MKTSAFSQAPHFILCSVAVSRPRVIKMASLSSCHPFTSLPTEIIEEIFYHIPIPDLLRNTSLVCRRWHSIIAASTFSTYRKNYYKYKIASPFERRGMLALPHKSANTGPLIAALHRDNMQIIGSPYLQDGERINKSVRFLNSDLPGLSTSREMEMIIPWIIRFVCDKFDGDFSQVKKHTKYKYAAAWMEEMLPEVAQQNTSAGIVALLCAVSRKSNIRLNHLSSNIFYIFYRSPRTFGTSERSFLH